jgi:hypothetical protein
LPGRVRGPAVLHLCDPDRSMMDSLESPIKVTYQATKDLL